MNANRSYWIDACDLEKGSLLFGDDEDAVRWPEGMLVTDVRRYTEDEGRVQVIAVYLR